MAKEKQKTATRNCSLVNFRNEAERIVKKPRKTRRAFSITEVNDRNVCVSEKPGLNKILNRAVGNALRKDHTFGSNG